MLGSHRNHDVLCFGFLNVVFLAKLLGNGFTQILVSGDRRIREIFSFIDRIFGSLLDVFWSFEVRFTQA